MSKYWVGGTGNTNDPTNHWATTSGGAPGAGNAPTAADDIFFDANSGSGTVTINAALAGRSLQTAGSTVTSCTHNSAITVTLGDATAGASNKALDLSGFSTYTLGNATTSAISLISTNATQQTITTNGKTLGNITINGAASSYLLADAMTSTGTLTLTTGALDSGSFSVTTLAFVGTGSATRGLTLGTTTWSLTATSGTPWNMATSGATLSVASSTITISTTSASTRTFTGGGFLYGTLNYILSGSTGQLTYSALYLDTLNFSDTSNTRTLALVNGGTSSIRVPNITGTSGKLMTISSQTGGTKTYLEIIGAQKAVDYASIQDVYSVIPNKLFATNSTDVSGNVNITFSAATSGPYIRYRADATASGGSISATFPFGKSPVAGNLIVFAAGTSSNGTGTVTPPSGFALDLAVSAATSLRVYSKISDGTETTISFSISPATPAIIDCKLMAIDGWSGTPTLDVTDTNNAASVTTLDTTAGTGPTNTAQPAIAIAVLQGSGNLSTSISVTNGFGIMRDSAELSAIRVSANLLTTLAAVDTTYTWTTSRNAVHNLVVYKDVASGASFRPKVAMFM